MPSHIDLAKTYTREVIRSTFNPPHPFEHTFTCNTGEVIPLFIYPDVLPHDTLGFKVNIMVRQQTPLHPTIGRAYWMWVAYYSPHSQVYDNWDALMGEVKDAAWKTQTTYTAPKITFGNAIAFKSFWDHAGFRPGIKDISANALALRHYLHICNEWLRDQNVEAPIEFLHTDAEINTNDQNLSDLLKGQVLYKINRKADYFSTALPEPQRGEPVSLPISFNSESAPVVGHMPVLTKNEFKLTGGEATRYRQNNGTAVVPQPGQILNLGINQDHKLVLDQSKTTSTTSTVSMHPTNLYAIGDPAKDFVPNEYDTARALLSTITNNADINDLRHAAKLQQIFELDARAGVRAPEMLWARWGVEVDELELGRPRMLASDQGLISIFQVEQTSESTENSPQGNLGAFGIARSESDWNTASFKYAGCFSILFWIRTEHKYQYGIPKWSQRFERFDFWHPEFDGEGDQPIYTYEIYANSNTVSNKTIFGYAERGADYKNFPSIITGELRSEYPLTLDSWTYADKYDSMPTLSNEWMKESVENVDRTIAVQSTVADQWLVDASVEMEWTRAMRVHSIPGIDRI